MKKNISAVLVLLLLVAITGYAVNKPKPVNHTIETVETASDSSEDTDQVTIKILATSDLHGMFFPWDYAINEEHKAGSMLQLSTAIKELRDENTLVMDAGDTIQDNSADIFLNEDVHPMIQGLNAIGFDAWTTGNHEYNFGMDTLKKVMASVDAKIILNNVYDEDNKPLADGYTIFEKNGIKIGVIGMVTPNITKWDGPNLKGYTVTDPVEETKKIIDKIKDETDVLIALSHMGVTNEYNVANSGVTDLANECPELDVIIASHQHELIESMDINGVLVVENKYHAQTMSEITLDMKKDENGWHLENQSAKSHHISDYEADPELEKKLLPYHETALKDAETVIGKLEGGSLVEGKGIKGI
ncbi:MAG: metallophosphoesterase, partial [Lachnospiraceae bacterium]|nr:metallophosphoesterase [Lachnospiraceae bacterium]